MFLWQNKTWKVVVQEYVLLKVDKRRFDTLGSFWVVLRILNVWIFKFIVGLFSVLISVVCM